MIDSTANKIEYKNTQTKGGAGNTGNNLRKINNYLFISEINNYYFADVSQGAYTIQPLSQQDDSFVLGPINAVLLEPYGIRDY